MDPGDALTHTPHFSNVKSGAQREEENVLRRGNTGLGKTQVFRLLI
jgi:hypothetical protein